MYNDLYIIHCNNIIFVVVKKMLLSVVPVNRSLMSLTINPFPHYIILVKQCLYMSIVCKWMYLIDCQYMNLNKE